LSNYICEKIYNTEGVDILLVTGTKNKKNEDSDRVFIFSNPNAVGYENLFLGVSNYFY